MSEVISEDFKRRLGDIGGRLPDGTPKLRLVFAPDMKRPHGKLAGLPKYIDPDTGKPMPFWVLEIWIPPVMCGERENWNSEFMGPYPADCDLDCCNRGYWGIKTPIATANGEYLPINESVMQSIERKQYMDIQWSLKSETEQLAAYDARLLAREQKANADAMEEYFRRLDRYATNKEREDNADNRVFAWADKYMINAPKMPIGSPKV